MYQSKLAKPEVKPHIYWNKNDGWWFYDADVEVVTNEQEMEIFRICDKLDDVYNPLRSGK